MHVKSIGQVGVDVQLSPDELMIINNALNEVCNGLDMPEFATRVGAELEEAKTLLQQVHNVCDKIRG